MNIPRATYRLQLNRELTFRDATALVPYLHRIGISHLYASPFFRARPGSLHGYDVVDHQSLNPEIGTEEDLAALFGALRAHGMAMIVDVVPNHMGVLGSDNPWWMDVLENGQAARHAHYFDIDWQAGQHGLQGKLLLPVLGDHYGALLQAGRLQLAREPESGAFFLRYEGNRFPLDPTTYAVVFRRALAHCAGPASGDLEALLAAATAIPSRDSLTSDQRELRYRRQAELKETHTRLCAADPGFAPCIDETLQELNGDPANPQSFDALAELLDAQAYRLAYWRVASDEVNYRRFFDINELAGLRMEDEEVFEATHRYLFSLLQRGPIDGLRIDHPDGLFDPKAYCQRLQARHAKAMGSGEGVRVVLEKILAAYERLPEDWPVAGTTGYRFMNLVNGLFVDAGAEMALDRLYESMVGSVTDFEQLVYDSKRLVVKSALASELGRLADGAARIAQLSRNTRDFSGNSLQEALAQVIACFPVYRTYLDEEGLHGEDRRYIEWAVAWARKRSRAADPVIFDFLRALLTADLAAEGDEAYGRVVREFARRFQQVTGPAMAKGFEDTVCYRYARFLSLNEVGGEPRSFGISLGAFHSATADRAQRWPHTMLATSTHDGKRSEDARARLNVLSEMPTQWRHAVNRWTRLNRYKKSTLDERHAPTARDEYYFYQSLLAAWPAEEVDQKTLEGLHARLGEHMLKAAREAKLHTSWLNADSDYEAALSRFVDECLGRLEGNAFLSDFAVFARRCMPYGLLNGLSQTLLKLASPGVPDFYQGSEIWQWQLVDPDNRRPVDFAQRQRLLREVEAASASRSRLGEYAAMVADTLPDGRAKLLLVVCALRLRAELPALFADGDYLPLPAEGVEAHRLCAFARRRDERMLIALAPRLWVGLVPEPERPLEQSWGDTRIALGENAPTRFLNVLTGEHIAAVDGKGGPQLDLEELLTRFPVGLLIDAKR
jgi:(1->4)-alpha-D-glucan 1-alpha-D-glucosylmutase